MPCEHGAYTLLLGMDWPLRTPSENSSQFPEFSQDRNTWVLAIVCICAGDDFMPLSKKSRSDREENFVDQSL